MSAAQLCRRTLGLTFFFDLINVINMLARSIHRSSLLQILRNLVNGLQALLHRLGTMGKLLETSIAVFGEQEVDLFESQVRSLGIWYIGSEFALFRAPTVI